MTQSIRNNRSIKSNIAFDPANIVLNKKETYFNNYNQAASIIITSITNNFGVGASFYVPIQTNGDEINIFDGVGKIADNYQSDSNTYGLLATYTGFKWVWSLVLEGSAFVPVALLTFNTTSDNLTTFDADATVSAGVLNWDLGDGTVLDTNNVSHTYADGTSKTVQVFAGSTIGAPAVTVFDMRDDALVGGLDVSQFTNLNRLFVQDNAALTGITFGNVSGNFDFLACQNCNITGVLDLSTLLDLDGAITIQNNAITGITLPTNSNPITFTANDNDLTGVLNLSTLTGLSGYQQLHNNSNLTGIIFPATTANVSLKADACGLLSLDLSMLSNLSGSVNIRNNFNLTSISFPTSPQNITFFGLANCDITGALDLSGLLLGGNCQISNNNNLTSITFGATSNAISSLTFNDDNITGTLDISPLTNITTTINGSNNPLMTGITLPSTTNTIATFNLSLCALGAIDFSPMTNLTDVNNCAVSLQDNGMIDTEVDSCLASLDSISSGGFTGRSINISGTNAAPTAAGLASKTSLEGKGFSVTVTV